MSNTAEAANRPSLVSRVTAFVQDNLANLGIWFLLVLMCVPMLYPYFVELWSREHYRYFPFAILVAGYLFHDRFDGSIHPPRGVFGWALITTACLAVIASIATAYAWFAAFGFVLVGISFFWSQRSLSGRTLVLLAVPFAMLLQLPFRTDKQLIVALQGITTNLASLTLDLIAVPHAVSGNVIALVTRELFVAEACSGIQSVFTLAFLACVILAWQRRPLWVTPVYLGVAVMLAVFANVIRVSSIAIADTWYQLDWSSGIAHDVVGYFCLTVAIGFLVSFDFLVSSLAHRVEPSPACGDSNPFLFMWNAFAFSADSTPSRSEFRDSTQASPESSQFESLIDERSGLSGRSRGTLIAVAAICVPLMIGTVVQVFKSRSRGARQVSKGELIFEVPDSVGIFDQSILDVTGQRTVREGSDPRLGENADLWQCEGERMTAQFVVSQPFRGWHELCVCYDRQDDWRLVDRVSRNIQSRNSLEDLPEEDLASYAVGRFKHSDQLHGYLFFSAIRVDGTIVEAPSRLGSFGARFLERMDYGGVWELEDVAMLQAWCVTDRKLSMEEYAELEEEFIRFRSRASQNARLQASGADVPASSQTDDVNTDREPS